MKKIYTIANLYVANKKIAFSDLSYSITKCAEILTDEQQKINTEKFIKENVDILRARLRNNYPILRIYPDSKLRTLVSKILLKPRIKKEQLDKLVKEFIDIERPGYQFEDLSEDELEGGISNL